MRNIENEVYEKDDGEEFRERNDKSEGKEFLDTLMDIGFFQKYQEEMNKIPKRVVPKEKADYEYLLGECDAYVRQFGGRIRGEVDYQKWQATIDLYLEHFEFCDREALMLLKEIAERAENVTFSIKDGFGCRCLLDILMMCIKNRPLAHEKCFMYQQLFPIAARADCL